MKNLLLFTFSFLIFQNLLSQEKFLQFNYSTSDINKIKSGDIDNDGDIDFLVEDGHWLENIDGLDVFDYKKSEIGSSYYSRLLDIDGDGNLDIVFTNSLNIEFRKNDGLGNFGSKQVFMSSGSYFTLIEDGLKDVDGDGDIDVIYAQSGAYYLNVNEGGGTFNTIDLGIPDGANVEIIRPYDWNNDFYLDIIVYASPDNGDLNLYLNDGTNNYPTNIPIIDNQAPLDNYNYILSDYDADGDVDIVSNTSKTMDAQGLFLYRNDGAFNFSNETLLDTSIDLSIINEFKTHDLDGDSDIDVVFSMKDPNHNFLDKMYWAENNGVPSENGHLLSDLFGGEEIAIINIDDDPDEEVVVLDSYRQTMSSFKYNNGQVDNFIIHGTGNKTTDIARYIGFIAQKEVDYDGDSHNDYLGVTISGISLYTNTGQKSFEGKHLYRFKDFSPQHEYLTMDIHFDDYDNDGDLDVLYKAEDQGIIFLENLNYVSFVETKIYQPTSNLAEIVTGDIDSDGDIDVLFYEVNINSNKTVVNWLENIGGGNFTHAILFNGQKEIRRIALSDIDEDGQIDVLLGKYNGVTEGSSLSWYKNDNLSFTEAVIESDIPKGAAKPLTTIVSGDLEGDGDIDVVLGIKGSIWIFENGGAESFIKLPSSYDVPYNITNDSEAIKLVDIDADNDLDMVLSQGQIEVWENNNNAFAKEFVSNHDFPLAGSFPVLADFDNDLDMDFFVIAENGIRYFENLNVSELYDDDFEGMYIDSSHDGVDNADYFDIDNDGDVDVIGYSTFRETLSWYENDGNENFLRHDIDIENPYVVGPKAIEVSDLDNDGDGDIIIYDDVYRNDNGNFVKVIEELKNVTYNYGNAESIDTKDIDNDGDADILYIEANTLILLENKGNFIFDTKANFFSSKTQAQLLDVDSDGLLDLVCVDKSTNKSIQWYGNNGNWSFTQNIIPTNTTSSIYDYEMADLNSDGHEDFIYSSDQSLIWFVNDGAQNFTEVPVFSNPYPYSKTRDFKSVDMDMDGYIDIVISYQDKYNPSIRYKDNLSVLLNNGDGSNFVEYRINSYGSEMKDLDVVDIDNDGDDDIISSDTRLDDIIWYENEAFVSTELKIDQVQFEDISCAGADDASINVFVSGGTSPYTYELFNSTGPVFSPDGNFTNLSPDNHEIRITDFLGTLVTEQIEILEPATLSFTTEITNVTCKGNLDGMATINASGGTPYYQYQLNGGEFVTSNIFQGIGVGNHVFTVRDVKGCESTQTFDVSEPESMTMTFETSEASCASTNDGALIVSAIGGSGQYDYKIDGGPFVSSNTFIELAAGTYVATVRDENGCTLTQQVTISSGTDCPDFMLPSNNFTIQVTSETCASSNNGSVLITALENLDYKAILSGGTIDKTKDFRAFASFQDLEAGTYETCITVGGQAGYEKCFTVQITEPEALFVDSKVDTSGKSVSLKLKGGTNYSIHVNGTVYNTSEDEIILPLSNTENKISVKTDKDCQGIYEETILIAQGFSIYPNPIDKGDIAIQFAGFVEGQVHLLLYDHNGRQLLNSIQETDNGKITFNTDGLSSGVYSLKIITDSQTYTRRIIKK